MSQEVTGSFVFWVPCKFVMEEHYCNSFASVVVSCIGCLAVTVEHIRGNWEVVEGGTVGVVAAEPAEEAADIAGVAGLVCPLLVLMLTLSRLPLVLD